MKKTSLLLTVLVLIIATIVITSCTNDKAPTTTAPVGTTAAPGTSGDTTTTTTPDGTTVPPATTPVVTTTNPPVVTTTNPPVVTTTNPPVTTTEPIWNVIDEDPDSPAVIGEDGSIFSSVAYTALHKELADSIEGYYTLDIHGNDDNRNGLVIGYTNTDGLEEYYFVWLNFDALIINKNGSDVVWNTGPFGWNPNHFPRDSRVTISASVSYTEDGKLKIRGYVNGTYTVEWIDDAPLTGTGFGLKAEQPGVKAYSTSYTPEIPKASIGNWGYWFDDLPEGTYIPSEYNSLKVVGTASKLAGQYKVTVKGTKHAAGHNSGLVFGLTDLEGDNLFWEAGSNYYFTWISNDGKMNLARVGVDGQIWNHVAASGKIYDYRHGDSLDLVVNVYEDGKIQIYANGLLYIDWTDATPFTGTGYGVRAEVEGTVFTNLSYSETITEVKSDVTVETLEGYNYIKYTSADGSVKYMTKELWAGPMALGNVTSSSALYEVTLTNAILADNMINFYIAGDEAAGKGTDVWSGNAYAIGFHANGLLAVTKLVGTGWDGQEVIWNGYYKLPSYTVDDDIKLKIEYKIENGKGYINVWIQGPYDADYVLVAEVVDDNPHTGTGYGLKMPMSGSIAADIKVTEAK